MKILKNLEWVYEKITEYANIEIIDKNSIIYGGIIRDIIAKKELYGDIDMVILNKNLNNQLDRLNNDLEWRHIFKTPQALKIEKIKYNLLKYLINDKKPKINKNNLMNTKINNNNFSIYEFKNYNDRVLQIITTNDITALIQNVDFICCGLGMNCNGDIIEYLDGAYDDCINNILRINTKNSNPQTLINKHKQRLSKLTQRGWKPYNISRDKKIIYKKLYLQNKKNKQKEKILNLKNDKLKPEKCHHKMIDLNIKADKNYFDDFKTKYLAIDTALHNPYVTIDTTTTTTNTY